MLAFTILCFSLRGAWLRIHDAGVKGLGIIDLRPPYKLTIRSNRYGRGGSRELSLCKNASAASLRRLWSVLCHLPISSAVMAPPLHPHPRGAPRLHRCSHRCPRSARRRGARAKRHWCWSCDIVKRLGGNNRTITTRYLSLFYFKSIMDLMMARAGLPLWCWKSFYRIRSDFVSAYIFVKSAHDADGIHLRCRNKIQWFGASSLFKNSRYCSIRTVWVVYNGSLHWTLQRQKRR